MIFLPVLMFSCIPIGRFSNAVKSPECRILLSRRSYLMSGILITSEQFRIVVDVADNFKLSQILIVPKRKSFYR